MVSLFSLNQVKLHFFRFQEDKWIIGVHGRLKSSVYIVIPTKIFSNPDMS